MNDYRLLTRRNGHDYVSEMSLNGEKVDGWPPELSDVGNEQGLTHYKYLERHPNILSITTIVLEVAASGRTGGASK